MELILSYSHWGRSKLMGFRTIHEMQEACAKLRFSSGSPAHGLPKTIPDILNARHV
jgi:hypothetical protein